MTTIHRWLAEPLAPDVERALERLAQAPGARRIAVMPDVHLADAVCVGTVFGTDGRIYPQAVGADIGCGMAAVALAAPPQGLDAGATRRLLDELHARVPAIRHRLRREAAVPALSEPRLQQRVARDAAVEFGTLGRGNHFLELQVDEQDRFWLMVHSGSRCVGPAVLAHHLARGDPVGKGLVALPADGDRAQAFLHDVDAAVDFARRNRRAVADAAAAALGSLGLEVDWPTWFDCVHNSVRRETHGGEALWVHRKGACPAASGERGIVPGSMGTRSFHVEGRGVADAMASCAHGAGRALPRGAAMRTITAAELRRQMRGVAFDDARAASLRDEAPSAYKDIGAVMRSQRDLVRVVRTLRPVVAFKGT